MLIPGILFLKCNSAFQIVSFNTIAKAYLEPQELSGNPSITELFTFFDSLERLICSVTITQFKIKSKNGEDLKVTCVPDRNEETYSLYLEITQEKNDLPKTEYLPSFLEWIAEKTHDWEGLHDNKGTLIWINNTVETLTGYSKEHCLKAGDYPFFMLTEDYKVPLKKCFSDALKGMETNSFEFSITTRKGEKKWMQLALNPLTEEKDNFYGFRTSIRDISTQKKRTLDLEKVQLLFSETEKIANLGAWELDLETNKTLWTEQVYAIHEVDLDYDHNKTNGIDFYHPDYRALIAEAIEHTIKTTEPFDIEAKFITAKGRLRWVRSAGYPEIKENKVVKLIGIFQDITKAQEDKFEFEKAHKFSSLLLNSMHDGLLVFNSAGEILNTNPSFCNLVKFSRENLIGLKPPFPFLKTESSNLFFDYAKNLDAQNNTITIEYNLVTSQGENLVAIINLSLIRINDEVQFFATFKDITARKRLEDELTMLSLAAQKTESGIVLTDAERRIQWVNPGFEKITGYSLDELRGKKPKFLLGKETNPEHVLAFKEGLKSGKPVKQEILNYHKSGKPYWVDVHITPMFNERGEIIQYIAVEQDITEKKERDLILKEEQERFSLLAKTSSALVYLCKNDENWTPIFYNDVVEEITGYPKEAFIGGQMTFLDIMYPEDITKVAENTTASLKKGIAYQNTFRITHKNGETRWLSEFGDGLRKNGTLTYLGGIITDITELVLVQEELINLNAKLSLTNSVAKVGYWEMDFIKNKLQMSEVTKEILGIKSTHDPILEETFQFFKTGENRNKMAEHFNLALQSGIPYDIRVEVVNLLGEEYWVRAKGIPLMNGSECEKIYGTFQDITREVAYEVSLLEKNELLRKKEDELSKNVNNLESVRETLLLSNKILSEKSNALDKANKTKSKLISIIGHDLNNPLNNLLAVIEMAKENFLTAEEFQNYLEDLGGQIQSLQTTLSDLFLWAKTQQDEISISKQTFVVEKLLTDVFNDTVNQAKEKGLKLNFSGKVDAKISADYNQVKILLRNLVSNAIKFSNKGEEVLVSVEPSESHININIVDKGVGIKPEVMENLFSQNSVTSLGTNYEKGTGFGLQICKDFAQANNGEILVQSEVGKGTTFTFRLPKISL
ncbi:MAG: PAS domain S-box protein [Luteibaculaceae bacterium]